MIVSSSPPNSNHSCHRDNDCTTPVKLLQHAPSTDCAEALCQRVQLRYSNPRPLSDVGCRSACQLHELPKYQALPAVRSDCLAAIAKTPCQQCAKETASIDSFDSGFITSDSPSLPDKHKTVEELDAVLQLFDKSVVLVWLEQTKRCITDISDWSAEEENFICFAHFWLSEFPSDRRSSMFEFEYSLLRDKIASGCRNKQPSPDQLASLLSAILHEFPEGRLSRLSDAYIFLELLESLAEKHKRDSLLAGVAYLLHNRQHYDCLLALRSYAIVSICSAVLDKYRSGVDSVKLASKKKTARPSTAQVQTVQPLFTSSPSIRSRPSTAHSKSRLDPKSLEYETVANADISSQKRMFDAIRLFKLHYYLLFVLHFAHLCMLGLNARPSTMKVI